MTSIVRLASVPALSVVGALALAACGGTSGGGTASTPAATPTPSMSMPMPSPSASPAPASPASTTSVTISNNAFSPATIKVPVGATVTWTNQDQVAHNVAFTGEAPSKTMQTGATYTHTFTAPGTYSYICAIHPFMKGTVVVG
jgi:amicyanin